MHSRGGSLSLDLVPGSVRKAGRRVRITGQLIDTVTGAHLWAGWTKSTRSGRTEVRQAEIEGSRPNAIGSLEA